MGRLIKIFHTLLPILLFSDFISCWTWRCVKRTYSTKSNRMENIAMLRWPDHTYQNGGFNDLFFDRVGFIHHEGEYDKIYAQTFDDPAPAHFLSVTILGVIIGDKRFLTSFNPFRKITIWRFKIYYTHVCVMMKRRYVSFALDWADYVIGEFNIVCARQIVAAQDNDIPRHLWHGFPSNSQIHSPIHDLMVVQFNQSITLYDALYVEYTAYLPYENQDFTTGGLLTRVAGVSDTLGRDIKFGMRGHSFSKNYFVRRNMYVGTFAPDENVETDCDGWVPREWGRFICLHNLRKVKRLASGAIMFSNKKLFGIGSFVLFKGKRSVLVFTDARAYNELIMNTCTPDDSTLVQVDPPKECTSGWEMCSYTSWMPSMPSLWPSSWWG